MSLHPKDPVPWTHVTGAVGTRTGANFTKLLDQHTNLLSAEYCSLANIGYQLIDLMYNSHLRG